MTTVPVWRAQSRRASPRVRANDAQVLDAAVEVLARDGWGGFSAAAVARDCDLSKRAVSTRYRTRAALAADTWLQRCEPALSNRWTAITTAEGAALVEELMRMTGPTPVELAAIELLLIASYEPDLASATLGFREWIHSGLSGLDPTIAARRAYAGAVGLGLICASHDPIAPADHTRSALISLADAVGTPSSARAIPDIPAEHLRGTPPMNTGDDITDALLTSALELITEEGFDGVSVVRISERAGVSEGALFNRYSSKVDLLREAVEIANRTGFALNNDYMGAIARDHGAGVAEAVMIRHILHPQTRTPVVMNLEQSRVSWHYPELAAALRQARDAAIDAPHATEAALSRHQLGLATGYGFMLLGLLDTTAWQLPFDVVSVPLEG